MRASLALSRGTVWLARPLDGGRVVPFDLGGRALGDGFAVAAEAGRRARITSIAVDADHRVWLADAGARRVRCFNAFGLELAGLATGDADRPGESGEPASVAADGVELEAAILVASREPRRHGLQLLRPDGATLGSLRSMGESGGAFPALGRCALRGRRAWVCERAGGRVQVFRDQEFEFAFRVPGGDGATAEAVRPLSDGRLVVAVGGAGANAVLLCSASGETLRVLARAGGADGEANEPEDVVVDEVAGSERRSRVLVVDGAGARIQVLNLAGDCYGTFLSERGDSALEGT